MEYFFLVRKDANLFRAMPELRKYTIHSAALRQFPHIIEFARQKCGRIVSDSLGPHCNEGIEICYIYKGRYEWEVEGKKYVLHPGDTFVTLPWETHGSPGRFLDIGMLAWLILKPGKFGPSVGLDFGNWSKLSRQDQSGIGAILKNRSTHFYTDPAIGRIFGEIYSEFVGMRTGFTTRINNLIEDVFILSARHFEEKSKKNSADPAQSLIQFEKRIKNDLSRPWSPTEMAALLGMGRNAFIEKIRQLTGFTPRGYLIQLRLEEARRLIAETSRTLTAISLDCGFYSVQHFSDTFKKWVGMAPKEYRKKWRLP